VPDIRLAVVEYVLEIGAHAGDRVGALRVGHAAFQGDLLEFLAAEIVEEKIGQVVVGDEHVHESVAVVVGDHSSHALARVCLAMPVSADTSVKVPSPLLRYSVFGRGW
jgi:hypothetical protein